MTKEYKVITNSLLRLDTYRKIKSDSDREGFDKLTQEEVNEFRINLIFNSGEWATHCKEIKEEQLRIDSLLF
jgi:hypothetical protein